MNRRSYRDTDCRPSLLRLGCMRLLTLERAAPYRLRAPGAALVDRPCAGVLLTRGVSVPRRRRGRISLWRSAENIRGIFAGNKRMPLWKRKRRGCGAGVQRQLASTVWTSLILHLCHAVDAERFEDPAHRRVWISGAEKGREDPPPGSLVPRQARRAARSMRRLPVGFCPAAS